MASSRLCTDGCETQQPTTAYRHGVDAWLCDTCNKRTQPGHYRLKDGDSSVDVKPALAKLRSFVMVTMDEEKDNPYDDQRVIMCLSADQAEEMAQALLEAAAVLRAAARRQPQGAKCGKGNAFASGQEHPTSNGQQCNAPRERW